MVNLTRELSGACMRFFAIGGQAAIAVPRIVAMPELHLVLEEEGEADLKVLAGAALKEGTAAADTQEALGRGEGLNTQIEAELIQRFAVGH